MQNAASVTIAKSTTTDDNTTAPIRRRIKNLSAGTTVNAIFDYEIMPDVKNPAGALNEPTSVQITFNDVVASSSEDSAEVIAEAYGVVDFTGTTIPPLVIISITSSRFLLITLAMKLMNTPHTT